MFEIDFLSAERVIRWRMTGFWTEATALQFEDALRKEMARVRKLYPRFSALSDTRGFPVQSEPVMKILTSMSSGSIAEGSRKLAILVSTTLNQLQAQRSFQSDRIRIFRDEEEAIAWLTAPPQAQAQVS